MRLPQRQVQAAKVSRKSNEELIAFFRAQKALQMTSKPDKLGSAEWEQGQTRPKKHGKVGKWTKCGPEVWGMMGKWPE